MLPKELKEQRPDLLLSQAWVMHDRLQLHKIAPIIQQLELLSIKIPLDNACTGGLKIFQAILCYWAGKGTAALKLLLEAQKILSEKHPRMAGLIEIYFCMSSQMVGHTQAALALSNQKIKEHNEQDKIFSSRLFLSRAFLQLLSGKLTSAAQDARRVTQILAKINSPLMLGWGNYIEGASYFHLNNLPAALEKLSPFIKNKYNMNPRVAIDSMISLTLIYQTMQQADTATKIMHELLHFSQETGQPEHLLVAQSGQARLALAQGNIDLATQWLTLFDDQPSVPSMFLWLENPVITQARVMLAIGSSETLQEAGKILTSLLQETRALHNICQVIEIMSLQVLVLHKSGYESDALTAMEQLIALAEPGQWLQPFIESGQPMINILERFAEQKGGTQYLSFLLDKCKSVKVPSSNSTINKNQPVSDKFGWQGEALTNREIQILQLLTQRMQNKEIAAKLFVSPETIKTHLKHLYQKLGVSSRRAAADIAKEFISA